MTLLVRYHHRFRHEKLQFSYVNMIYILTFEQYSNHNEFNSITEGMLQYVVQLNDKIC